MQLSHNAALSTQIVAEVVEAKRPKGRSRQHGIREPGRVYLADGKDHILRANPEACLSSCTLRPEWTLVCYQGVPVN
jgi:hypothetical protein